MKAKYPKVCPLCGVTFIPARPNRKYCTERCTRIANRIRSSRTNEKREYWLSKARPKKMNRLDEIDPDDLLHYGRYQAKAMGGK